MSTMLYKEGKGTRVWGKQYNTIVVKDSDVDSHLAEGWHKHPDDVHAQKAEQPKIKRTRKTNAEAAEEVDDEHVDEGRSGSGGTSEVGSGV
ncbi:hypothetical protein [Pseudescherichia sp.]|uniref:hypothetical protein n=1 Tax=Pseudescherichia sp. TaxID=2055881 RepID=UPI00289E4821|nr:hypothetical protein [Pseudescherichia sp.]